MSGRTGKQVFTFLTDRKPCEQFLNSFIWYFYEGRTLEKSLVNRLFFLQPPPPPPPTSHELQYISVTSGFKRLSMKTKYVCRGFISPYVIFHYNRTMWSTNLHVKICRWGGAKEKEPVNQIETPRNRLINFFQVFESVDPFFMFDTD